MDQKGHIIDQKGLKLYKNGNKFSFWTFNACFQVKFSLAELGSTPPPLNRKFRSVVFDGFTN